MPPPCFTTRLPRRLNRRPAQQRTVVVAAAAKPPNICVFSAKPYVHSFLEAPLDAAFPGAASYTAARLAPETAKLAAGASVASIFVNDDASAASLQGLADAGVTHISLRCAGFDNVDLSAAAELGMTVTRVPTYSPRSVAEHGLALAMTLLRSTHRAYARLREYNFELSGIVGSQLFGKTVGIIGTGAIGSAACQIYKGLGCRVLAFDIRPNPDARSYAAFVPLDELLAESDIVSLHVPLLPSTKHMINADSLAKMKHGAILINVSRGGLVDTAAVVDSLQCGRLGGLGLDVYEREGRLFFNDLGEIEPAARVHLWDPTLALLMSFSNTIVTPHCAFLTKEALAEIAATVVGNVRVVAAGEVCDNVVVAQK